MLRRRLRTGSAEIRFGLPARYSGARIGPKPPTRGIVARVAQLLVRAFVEPAVETMPPSAAGNSAANQRAPRPLRFAFFNRLSY